MLSNNNIFNKVIVLLQTVTITTTRENEFELKSSSFAKPDQTHSWLDDHKMWFKVLIDFLLYCGCNDYCSL